MKKLDVDFSEFGISMCITDTGGDHSDLSDDYSAIPSEMKNVAAHFGQRILRSVDSDDLVAAIPELRRGLAIGQYSVRFILLTKIFVLKSLKRQC